MTRIGRAELTVAAINLLARRTPYLEAEMLGLRDVVGPGSVCVDVGAAAGLYTLALSRLVGAGGAVHSVEPLAFAHPAWSRVLRAHDGANVRKHPVALGVEPGRGTMSVPMGRYGLVTGRSFLEWKTRGLGSNAEFAGQVEVVVEVDTLDHLAADLPRLDFVKIDVEGAELHVLEGGRHAIERFRPALLIEIEARHITRYQHSPEDLVEWLARRDYTMYAWRDRWCPTEEIDDRTRNYLFRADRGARIA